MSHVTLMIESCRTYEWVMSPARTRLRRFKGVMSHLLISHVTLVPKTNKNLYIYMNIHVWALSIREHNKYQNMCTYICTFEYKNEVMTHSTLGNNKFWCCSVVVQKFVQISHVARHHVVRHDLFAPWHRATWLIRTNLWKHKFVWISHVARLTWMSHQAVGCTKTSADGCYEWVMSHCTKTSAHDESTATHHCNTPLQHTATHCNTVTLVPKKRPPTPRCSFLAGMKK